MLVAEVRYDHVTDGRFRHGTKFPALAARQGAPKSCTFEQLAPELKPSELDELFSGMNLLFDAPLIAGLQYREQFLSAAEEEALAGTAGRA